MDFLYKNPDSLPSGHSDTSIPSGNADHSAWDTIPEENPNYFLHFDSCGNCENPITANYNATYLYYDDNDNDSHLYVDPKSSKSDNSFCMGSFDVCNYTDLETKDYNYWYISKLNTQPPAGLITLHVVDYYCKEITIIETQQKSRSSTSRILTIAISCLACLKPIVI